MHDNSISPTHGLNLKYFAETMEDNNMLDFASLLEKDWFMLALGPYLCFGDLRSVSVLNKTTQGAGSTMFKTWPEEIRELVRTWCGAAPSSLLIAGVEAVKDDFYKDNIFGGSTNTRNPAPIIRFQVDTLAYNFEQKRLTGHPWSEVKVNNGQPQCLGRIDPNVCFANASETQIFYCGGRLFAPDGENRRWIGITEMRDEGATATGIFDTRTGLWTRLASMPEPRCNAGTFRIGSRIYALGGELYSFATDHNMRVFQSTLCFDLEQGHWVESGIGTFPGDAHSNFAIVILDDGTVIVAGGKTITDWDGELGPVGGRSRQAWSLDIDSGEWTQLSDLPDSAGDVGSNPVGFHVKSDNQPVGTAVVMCKETWASLMPSGEWSVKLCLKGCELKMVNLDLRDNKVISSNKWLTLPPYHNVMDMTFGVQVDDMRLCWNVYSCIVR